MEKDINKLHKPFWKNALIDWRDYPYDKDQLEKERELLHQIFDALQKGKSKDPDFPKAVKMLIDQMADRASYFMDETFRLSRKAELAHVPYELHRIASEINDEIILIYEYVKKNIGFSDDSSDFRKRKNAAIKFLETKKKLFKFIKVEHLKDNSLFNEGGKQEKRNFQRRLLNKAIKDQGLGEWTGALLHQVAHIGDLERYRKKS